MADAVKELTGNIKASASGTINAITMPCRVRIAERSVRMPLADEKKVSIFRSFPKKTGREGPNGAVTQRPGDEEYPTPKVEYPTPRGHIIGRSISRLRGASMVSHRIWAKRAFALHARAISETSGARQLDIRVDGKCTLLKSEEAKVRRPSAARFAYDLRPYSSVESVDRRGFRNLPKTSLAEGLNSKARSTGSA